MPRRTRIRALPPGGGKNHSHYRSFTILFWLVNDKTKRGNSRPNFLASLSLFACITFYFVFATTKLFITTAARRENCELAPYFFCLLRFPFVIKNRTKMYLIVKSHELLLQRWCADDFAMNCKGIHLRYWPAIVRPREDNASWWSAFYLDFS